MAEDIKIAEKNASKREKYDTILPQMSALVEGEPNLIANLANIAAILKEGLQFFWVGFYLVEGNELVLGPFQGSVACTRIDRGRGVCGMCWETGKIMIVPNVEEFPGHIACSSLSKSEIVLPIRNKEGKVIMVLDVDSDRLNDFDQDDQEYLEQVVTIVEGIYEG